LSQGPWEGFFKGMLKGMLKGVKKWCRATNMKVVFAFFRENPRGSLK
jgi:hypothetical protein